MKSPICSSYLNKKDLKFKMDFEKLVNFCLFLLKFVGFSLNYEGSLGFIIRFWSIILSIIHFTTSIIGFHYVFNNFRDLENIIETFSICSNLFLMIIRIHLFIFMRNLLKQILENLQKINDEGESFLKFLQSSNYFLFAAKFKYSAVIDRSNQQTFKLCKIYFYTVLITIIAQSTLKPMVAYVKIRKLIYPLKFSWVFYFICHVS